MTGSKLVCVILLLVACISCSKDRPVRDDNGLASGEAAPAKVHIIEIKQMKFEPSEIRVKKGDSIRWINKDITDHDVTEQLSKSWVSSPLATGESWTMVVNETADYYCNLHQVMKGKIIVE